MPFVSWLPTASYCHAVVSALDDVRRCVVSYVYVVVPAGRPVLADRVCDVRLPALSYPYPHAAFVVAPVRSVALVSRPSES